MTKNINVFFILRKGRKSYIWNSNASENSCSLITTVWFFFWGGGMSPMQTLDGFFSVVQSNNSRKHLLIAFSLWHVLHSSSNSIAGDIYVRTVAIKALPHSAAKNELLHSFLIKKLYVKSSKFQKNILTSRVFLLKLDFAAQVLLFFFYTSC